MTRAHAILGASSADRWTHCPGSVKLSEGIDRRTSSYAEEGTAAHALAEHCLLKANDAADFLGWGIDIKDKARPRFVEGAALDWTVTPEMAEAVQVYVDLVRPWLEDPTAECAIEQRLDLSPLYPGMFGTADFVGFWPDTGVLRVVDYKHGQGVAVHPKDNPQLLYYGYGTLLRHGNRGVTAIELYVVQPRCPHPEGPVRVWATDAAHMLDFSHDLVEAAKAVDFATDQAGKIDDAHWRRAYTEAGDWCKWCPAFAVCPTAHERATASAQAAFTDLGDIVLSDPMTFGPAKLADILKQAAFLKDWIKSVEEHAHHEHEAGREIPGYKLVPKRATRKWIDEQKALAELQLVFDLADDALYEAPKFKSPAQVEKVVPGKNAKERAAKIAHLVESVSSGSNLVPVDDPRPPLRPEATTVFSEVSAD